LIFPYIEQNNLAAQINYLMPSDGSSGIGDWGGTTLPPSLEAGGNANMQVLVKYAKNINLYLCPTRRTAPGLNKVYVSDGAPIGDYAILFYSPTEEWSFENHPVNQHQTLRIASISGNPVFGDSVYNSGSWTTSWTPTAASIFTGYQSRDTFAWVTDGLSNTAMIAEKFIPLGKLGYCCNGSWQSAAPATPCTSPQGCGNDGFIYWDRPNGRGGYGATWLAGSVRRAMSYAPTNGDGESGSVMPTLGSWHPGIVNFLFVDGSVHSLNVNTSVTTLIGLGSVNDGAEVNIP
jgi:prepilin-type processing-associated H-X9-DG protein